MPAGRKGGALALLLMVAALGSAGCGGLLEGDAAPIDRGDEAVLDGADDMGSCPPSQWDCAGTSVTCRDVEYSAGSLPTISLEGACRCDLTRPAEPADCGPGELFVCGSLSYEGRSAADLVFEPVSCRCAVNSGYYCGHCVLTGLYASAADAGGCGLDAVPGVDSTAVYCGCGR